MTDGVSASYQEKQEPRGPLRQGRMVKQEFMGPSG